MVRRANEASWFYHKRGEQSGTSENPGRPAPVGDPAAAAPLGFSAARRPGQYHSRASSTAACPKSGRPRQRPCWCHGLNRATAPVRACRLHCTPGLPRACALPACVFRHLPCRARPAHRGRGAGASTSATSPASWLAGCSPRQSPAPFDRPRPLRAAVAPHARLDCLAAECRAARERAQSKGLGPAGVVDGPIIGAGRATRRRYDDEVPGTCAHTEPPTHSGPAAQPCRELPPA